MNHVAFSTSMFFMAELTAGIPRCPGAQPVAIA
jgi:hypothetical protein